MRAWIPAIVAVLVLATGCGAAARTPVVQPSVPKFTDSAAPSGSAPDRPVPQTCADLATPDEVGTILGMLITGEPQQVVGVAQANIGRTARLDCYYGARSGRPLSTATAWIGLATYTDPAHAQQRLTNTVADERDAGAQVNEVPVGAGTGVLLRGRTWMLVAVRGTATAVVTIEPGLVREDRAGAMLGQLADRALTPRTATPG